MSHSPSGIETTFLGIPARHSHCQCTTVLALQDRLTDVKPAFVTALYWYVSRQRRHWQGSESDEDTTSHKLWQASAGRGFAMSTSVEPGPGPSTEISDNKYLDALFTDFFQTRGAEPSLNLCRRFRFLRRLSAGRFVSGASSRPGCEMRSGLGSSQTGSERLFFCTLTGPTSHESSSSTATR